MFHQPQTFGRQPTMKAVVTIRQVLDLFWDKIDLDKSGELTRDELWAAAQVVTSIDPGIGPLLASFLKYADIDGDGSIAKQEWVAYTQYVNPSQWIVDSIGQAVSKMDMHLQSGMMSIFDETSDVLGMMESKSDKLPPGFRKKKLERFGVDFYQNEAGVRCDSLKQAWSMYRDQMMLEICKQAAAAHTAFLSAAAAATKAPRGVTV
eukprot:GEMP01026716.1.p1 GENE.GEMP01026716.1~~GEMP01026716.1.p1  ORF type:complete len:206 (+),score=39.28 GEMP01026716.1:119-736(+)